MGQEVERREFTREDRTRYRAKVRRCLDALAAMLNDHDFSVSQQQIGVEIEFNLVDGRGDPALRNAEALAQIADDEFQTELGLFNLEVNLPPVPIAGDGLAKIAAKLRGDLIRADEKASVVDAHLMMIGILPTLDSRHFSAEAISANPRYHLLSEQILAARGEDIEIQIEGVDRLTATADTIMPEAACTSTQLHLQVEPQEFAPAWNAAQAIAGVQLAVGANSPLLLGRQLWSETRIALFEQAADTRSEELKAQGVRPRVWFGDRWISSVVDLFEENSRYFPALLPVTESEDPFAELAEGRIPSLSELTLHNGTVYRWNRPVYDVADGYPHLRVENRVLPAGPTIVDTLANAALFYGLVKSLAFAEPPIWSQLPFAVARANFQAAARKGIAAELFWPNVGDIPAADLVVRHLLPLARAGLESSAVDTEVADHLLGVVERRCVTGRNGASWLIDAFLRRRQASGDTATALRELTVEYRQNMLSGEPVHTWS